MPERVTHRSSVSGFSLRVRQPSKPVPASATMAFFKNRQTETPFCGSPLLKPELSGERGMPSQCVLFPDYRHIHHDLFVKHCRWEL